MTHSMSSRSILCVIMNGIIVHRPAIPEQSECRNVLVLRVRQRRILKHIELSKKESKVYAINDSKINKFVQKIFLFPLPNIFCPLSDSFVVEALS